MDAPKAQRSLITQVRRVVHEGHLVLGEVPSLFLPYARARYGRDRDGFPFAFDSTTEVVIEGFPRSGNSFAVEAFRFAQARRVSIAHHLHVPAQVIAAARMHVPALVLIRRPEDALVSYSVRAPHLPLAAIARHYLRFYSGIHRHRRAFVVADFDEVTSDFGAVIRRVNVRFRSRFEEFPHTEANVQMCFRRIDEDNARKFGGGRVLGAWVARPSEEREAMKGPIRSRYRHPDFAHIRARLEHVYRTFSALSGR